MFYFRTIHVQCSLSNVWSQPTLVSVLRQKRIVSAAAGVCHSVFIDSSGIVYTCGKGKGLLGHGDSRICTVPKVVSSLEVCIAQSDLGVDSSYCTYPRVR